MSVRKFPWKYKPTAHDESMMESALSSHLYMVSEIGPTQFLIKGEESAAKFKVTIGDEQTCSGCTKRGGRSGGATSPDLCMHVYFVMLKVLRIPRTSTLAWQASLLDTEITNILSQRYQRQEERASRRRMDAAAVAASATPAALTSSAKRTEPGSTRVPKRELDPDDVCSVCQDDLVEPVAGTANILALVHCAYSCGAQLHAKCMRVWAEHQMASLGSSDKKLSCPLCRSPWCSTDPSEVLTNEQMIRELKIREHAPPPAAPSTANDESAQSTNDGSSSSTALVGRNGGSAASNARAAASAPRAAVRCNSCRKTMLIGDGRFMRCVHCSDDYNLCRVCFIRSKGIGHSSLPTHMLTERANHVHCFIEAKCTPTNAYGSTTASAASSSLTHEEKSSTSGAEFPYAYGIEWLPAPIKAPSLSSQLALTLQSREITHSDYELLLSLDENIRNNGRPMMNAYLTRSLPVPTIRTSSDCCLCSRAIIGNQALRTLPCYHSAHETCLQSQLMYDVLLECPLDHVSIFPGLAFCESKDVLRRKKKPTPSEEAMGQAQRSGALSVMASTMMFGLQGSNVGNSGFSTTSSGRSLPAEEVDSSESLAQISSSPPSIAHSHHFQLTPSTLPAGAAQSIREQRSTAVVASGGGKLRTGTAAFAAHASHARVPSNGSNPLFTAPLQLAGSSSFAPFVNDPPTQSHSTTNSAVRRGRLAEERTLPSSSPPPFTADISSLAIQSSPLTGATPTATPKPKGVRVRGTSQVAHSVSASPVSSPDAIDGLSIAAAGLLHQHHSAASAMTDWSTDDADPPAADFIGQHDPPPDASTLMVGIASSSFSAARASPPPSKSRPRVGRVPFSQAHDDAPTATAIASDLVVVTSTTPARARSSSASASATSVRAPNTGTVARGAPRVSVRDTPDPSDALRGLALGSGNSAPAARPAASSSARVRRGLPDRSPDAVFAFASPSPPSIDFAPLVSGLARPSPAAERPRATSATVGRRSTAPSAAFAAASTVSRASAQVAHEPEGSFNLLGSTFTALDRGGDQQPDRGPTATPGKLRRGRAVAGSGAPATGIVR